MLTEDQGSGSQGISVQGFNIFLGVSRFIFVVVTGVRVIGIKDMGSVS
jgi:hypothetical protein